MTTPPVAGFFNGAITNQQAKDAFDDVLAAMAETVGGAALATYEIASGSVVPTVAIFRVDTEAAAGVDDLDRVQVDNHPAGRVIMLASVSASRVVTLRHGQGGGGEVLSGDGASIVLADPSIWVAMVRVGLQWIEVARSFGSQKSAARLYLGLGTAAQRNVGVASSTEVPDRAAADARYAQLAVANVFSQDQTVSKATGAPRLAAALSGGPTMAIKAEGTTGRIGSESDHNVRVVRNNVSVLHLLSSNGVNVGEPVGTTGAGGLNVEGELKENGKPVKPQSWGKADHDGVPMVGENLLSVTNLGSDRLQFIWEEPFATADYLVVVTCGASAGRYGIIVDQQPGWVTIETRSDDGGRTSLDIEFVMVLALGEYA